MKNKMSISAIISEYNPFHNGHKYHIDKTRALGATHVVAVMSGNFVQRGDVAVLDKRTRTEAALLGGVDLVIELPVAFCLSCAEIFARSAVSLVDALGCVDLLSFGSESGNVDELRQAARISYSDDIQSGIRQALASGLNYPAAKTQAIKSLFPDIDLSLFNSPNNILAVEYIHALSVLDSPVIPITIRRSALHDSAVAKANVASASLIRRLICEGNRKYLSYLPEITGNLLCNKVAAGYAPGNISNIERAILYRLRCASAEDLRMTPDVCEGLENRIISCMKDAVSLNSLLTSVKTKRYTLSRIRRIVLNYFLSVTAQMQLCSPSYIRILGFNHRGAEILNFAKRSTKLPIIARAGDISGRNSVVRERFEFECRASDIYNLSTPKISECSSDYFNLPVKV